MQKLPERENTKESGCHWFFSTATLETRRQFSDVFKITEGNDI